MQDLSPIPVQYVGVAIVNGETQYIAHDSDSGYPYWTTAFRSATKTTLPESFDGEFPYLKKSFRIMAVHTTLELHKMVGPNHEQLEKKVAELESTITKISDDITHNATSGDWESVSKNSTRLGELMKERSDALAELRNQ